MSLELPRDALIVFTGLSGSGKSSLAFDTIFAEGQRRYVESLSAYARQFLGQMEKPRYDTIRGLAKRGHHITTVVRGYAASFGAVLLQAGDVRIVGPESRVMLHEVSSMAWGKLHEIKDQVGFTKELNQRIFDLIAERSGDRTVRQQGRTKPDPRHHLDPIGAVGAALTGLGWGRLLEECRRPRRTVLLVSLYRTPASLEAAWKYFILCGVGIAQALFGTILLYFAAERPTVERDGLIYNVAGILAGCIIAIIFFRKISFMVVAAFPPIIAILLALGGLGWAGFNLNMFLNVMTPLIMVISFSDAMQLTFAARDRLIAGQDKYTAFKNAVLVVGPACVLTHGTAGISFIALQFSDSELIRKFGEAGLAATIIALIAVLSLGLAAVARRA